MLMIFAGIIIFGCNAKDTHDYKAAAVANADSGALLFAENADERLACASITKLVTACVALEYAEPDEVFEVGTELELLPKHASRCLIAEGQRLTLYDLISGMLIRSGGDAAYTVAASVSRKAGGEMTDKAAVENFAELMNSFCVKIGMKNSRFTSPDGSDGQKQFTTARDLTVLVKYALGDPIIREITRTLDYHAVFESGHIIDWHNTNLLLDPESDFYSESCTGMKTGTTEKAGNCLAAVFEKGNESYIVIILGSPDDESRYKAALRLFDEYCG